MVVILAVLMAVSMVVILAVPMAVSMVVILALLMVEAEGALHRLRAKSMTPHNDIQREDQQKVAWVSLCVAILYFEVT